MELLVIWLLFGIASSVVASNKGRSGLGFFILGVLLGPFGLLIALVVSKDTEVLEKKAVTGGQQKKCPYCAEVIKREALKCRFCGSELEAEPNPQPDPNAGAQPSPMPHPKASQQTLAQRNRWVLIAVSIILITLLGMILLFFINAARLGAFA